ncbi:MAG: hypothetical protein DKM50_09760 [Candidatus Margulisiibacteriota bacterium]|nr:MAG: hypothetical protein A2X42_12080 [Candidatus Margulisbacteria bacterium GWF2_38_17]OGI10542.1 MAG: hypothetical protein A2X41_10855 [Candidatus Margulisbacteria bacterium GWE2_39_32]PZM78840.1 MAG: hypothetical protein DKM50_09760 [Candidatus Margulisiibacteriota bacterium]HAR64580.1 hypothetical protein [Candidatus Margulisiibacteriota bacterium]HCT84773.1 hypothetical protein [Candidatus Margulisiibacteriota bacterium]
MNSRKKLNKNRALRGFYLVFFFSSINQMVIENNLGKLSCIFLGIFISTFLYQVLDINVLENTPVNNIRRWLKSA